MSARVAYQIVSGKSSRRKDGELRKNRKGFERTVSAVHDAYYRQARDEGIFARIQ